ncbi:RHS repeat-associated protein [Flavobacterium sp. 270]|uniref:SpvB/TcaC N-terminal domain-containing protein n=1 Tax=Flavobacterium sp. 270 TaxID=2512114 RepID=UPI0010662B9B|nr:SpvB/TcaC N-terminal domain-containing protein [Flavobacterium sp. 270]TDW49139.1 RHS repeat-associated protein [Flavobacterium sp. 270]
MKEISENKPGSDFLKTDKGKTKSNSIEIPSISLPKGGGAIKGIDEKFSVNAANGTASFSVALPFSPARGASPSLGLSYSSGSGNGIFGLGWNLSLSSIKRKTDKEIPQYLDSLNSDTFLFSETEDLVPEFKKDDDGNFIKGSDDEYEINERDSTDGLFVIRNYRPRIEGLFGRIERWTEKSTARIKWRVITKDNATTLYGWTDNSILYCPNDIRKIYTWFPEFVFDDKGNCSQYIYKKEDETGFDESLLHNKNRLKEGLITYSNLYLEKVLYGNKTPYEGFETAFPSETDFMFQTVFDYGTTDTINESFEKINNWNFRPDAFSEYKTGFEIRTTRLCNRVLLFHVLDEMAVKPDKSDKKTLVRSLNFEYDTAVEQDFTFLKKISSYGYIKKTDGSYSYKKLPPMEFNYQKHEWNNKIESVLPEDLIHAPIGLDEQQYQFVDLYNEGLSGLLTEQGTGWYYKHNLGDGKFEQAKLVSPKPSFSGVGGQFHLTDLDADGGKQLVSLNDEPKGFFELNDDDEWEGFKSFKAMPNINFSDVNTRMLDLNGDGKPEVVISEDQVFTWYESDGKNGYTASKKTSKSFDEESGPNIVFADEKQTIYLADMSGSGMIDILRIRNGEICYWPNLGYGNFGAKVAMDNAPVFDHPDSFNPSYLRLSDIDGSGTADIIYLGKNKFSCWKNLSGNRFSTIPFEIDPFPEIYSQSKIALTDLLGNGLSCIVWSSSLPKDANEPLRYIDLMNSKKAHVMIGYINNMGKETALEYTPSTKFYLEDKKAGKPWVTKLHFPVYCVSKTTTRDKISGYKFVSEYKYHHGYYDHQEREFRGFGMVEQIDAETFEHWVKSDTANITEEVLHQEPVISKNWYHTGAFLRKDKILNQFENDYWYNEMNRKLDINVIHNERKLPEAKIILAPGIDEQVLKKLSGDEWCEALRACKGMSLRSEIFAKDAIKFENSDDAVKKELTPFSVSTHNCIIELLQPKGKNKYAVFIVKESEAVTYNYERNTEDPRIAHNLNIKLDQYANVIESASIVYPRLLEDASLPDAAKTEQNKTIVIYTQNNFTNDIIEENKYRLRLPSETKTYDIKGNKFENPTGLFKIEDFDNPHSLPPYNIFDSSAVVPYFQYNNSVASGTQKRLIEHARSFYYNNNLLTGLPLGKLDSLAISYQNHQLAYTPELLENIYEDKVDDTLLTEGKFVHSENDDNWWIQSGTTQFLNGGETAANAKNRFYLPILYKDPYEAETKVKYYKDYFLFIEEIQDNLGHKTKVESFNFRTLSPKKMKDINGNYSESVCDELGLVKAIAIMGKGSEADEIAGISEITDNTESALIASFFQAPDSVQLTVIGKELLKHSSARFFYDFENYLNSGQPATTVSIAREQHFKNNPDSPVQIAFEYSNGIGEVIMKKLQAEPGAAKQVTVNPNNTISITEINTDAGIPKQLRWIGNGRTIKNNKGKAVKQYEPYFAITWKYENYKELVETGVTPIMFYDAIGRLIKTQMPDDTFTKIEFDSWKQTVYDSSDTVLESLWYQNRSNRLIDAELLTEGKDPVKEKTAADKAAKHADTPNILHFNTLGRPVLSIEHNINPITNEVEFHKTKIFLDTEGNLRTVTDARQITENSNLGNIVMQYKYDMLGNLVYQNSMDSGERWLLLNILGNPLRTWDQRNHEFQYFYDSSHRPVYSKILGGESSVLLNNIFQKIIYAESLLLPDRSNETALQAINVLGKPIALYDTGGVMLTPEYDFKGQPLFTTQKLFKKYKETVNWTDANLSIDLEPGLGFTSFAETDALGRVTRQTAEDGSIITASYNESGLLNGQEVQHNSPSLSQVYIKNIDYNEKGQRIKIIYGNDVITTFFYDKKTFCVNHIQTKRKNNDPLQDWYYTFDAVGNITHIEDKNIPVAFFDNQKITGDSQYTYDALYRLIEAKGRENDAALSFTNKDNWNDLSYMHTHNNGDIMSVRNYTQSYKYDFVGNIEEMRHQASANNWTRIYEYEKNNNRLKNTKIGTETYVYKHHTTHGFITEMPHLDEMSWSFKEELIKTIRQKVNPGNGTAETTYYQYNGQGQRIRKITENSASEGNIPTIKNERIYIGGYETFRKYQSNTIVFERETLSLIDKGNRFAMIDTIKENTTLSPPPEDKKGARLTRYQLHNHLGSSALELDENAQIISYEEYHPFGTTAYQAQNATIKATAKRYRFTGMERDEETGLEYHSARYYIAWLARWLNTDPIGIGDGINVYAYCKGNPVMVLDPSGTDGETCGVWDEETLSCHAEACPTESTPLDEAPTPSTPPRVAVRRRPTPPPPEPPPPAVIEGPTIRAETNEERIQREGDQFLNLEANPWDMYPELGIPYGILKGLKHSIYVPIRELISETPINYIDSNGNVAEYTGRRDHTDAIPALANIALLFTPAPKGVGPGFLGEELSAEVVAENIAAWRNLAGSSAPIFEEGVAIGAADELALVGHGVRTEASIMEEAGASFVRIGERDLNPVELADMLQGQGWQGGTLRLLSCRTGVPCSEGVVFGESLSGILNGRGLTTTVVAPRGAVQIGSEMMGTGVPVISRTPEGVMTWGLGRTRDGVFIPSFNYYP